MRQINADMERDRARRACSSICRSWLNWGYLCLLQAIVAAAVPCCSSASRRRRHSSSIQRERVTYIATAPASIVAMLNEPDLASYDVSSLRVVITGGASAAIETIRDFQVRMPGKLIELYGMLETGFHTYTRFSDDPAKVNGTIGRVVSSMDLRILDEPGREVPRGEVGEIAALGPERPSRLPRQCRRPTRRLSPRTAGSAPAISGASSMPPATCEIVGRRKEIINRGGKKFFPREVEEILYTHPKIMHAAMVGIADARLGERNCLCVIPKAGQSRHAGRDGRAFLKGQVADYKLPEVLHVVEELPFTGHRQAAPARAGRADRQGTSVNLSVTAQRAPQS